MLKKDPEGYRKLLAYQKTQKLHSDVLEMVKYFPPIPPRATHYKNSEAKTIGDLADQMARSGRSGHKNIVEGWKRNTTQEYFDFLGFSIGAVEELKDDAADIVLGKYKELMGIKGVMGEKGVEREEKAVMREKGVWGDPLNPFTPLHPITQAELDKIPFYPLDQNLPLAVKIYLEAKEVNFLLYKLQKSLDLKMDEEHTKPAKERYKNYFDQQKQADKDMENYFADQGLVRLENGQMMTKQEWEQKGKPPLLSRSIS